MKLKVYQILITLLSLLLSPIAAIFLSFLFLYRRVVDVVLRIQLGEKYAGLLSGTDSVWAVEEASSRSVINVLVILEKDARHSNINFLESFKELVKERLVGSRFQKLLCTRRKKFGYHFWQRSDIVDLDERVRWLEYERTQCDGSCDNVYSGHLKRILWNVCNQPLPQDHSASWEILVGKCCPRSSHHYLRRMEESVANNSIRIPILFRVHHSLGDGMALLKLFREAVVDKNVQETALKLENGNFTMKTEEDLETITVTLPLSEEKMSYSCHKDVLSASMPFVHMVIFSDVVKIMQSYFETGLKFVQHLTVEKAKRELEMIARKEWKNLRSFAVNFFKDGCEGAKRFLRTVTIVLAAPACWIEQAVSSMDESSLHGAPLSGDKLVAYWLEDDFKNPSEQKLLTKVQNIKTITGARFGDVILAALSVSLHKYLLRADQTPPTTLSVVLPIRAEDPKLPLENNFSVALLPLCLSEANGETLPDPGKDSKMLERLQQIKRGNAELQTGPALTVNFWVMKHLAAALPEKLLRPVLESHSTMIFSNLVGPQEVHILGHPVKNLFYWSPTRSNTGISCSLLTYRGLLHWSLVADRALVSDEKVLTEILENAVQEIDRLYDRLTVSCFSKRLYRSVSTPRKKEVGAL